MIEKDPARTEQQEETASVGTDRHLRGEIKVIRRLVKLHVRQLDRADARAIRVEQKMDRLEQRLEWRQDRHLLLLTAVYLIVFFVTWFFR